MGRIRTIKPSFFTDDDIGKLPPLHRLLYVGLWTEADKLGRLEDRPLSIQVRLLPFDRDADVDAMLDDLHRGGFIQRYEVAGHACIEIPKFAKHQKPHPKEVDSGLPHPPPRTELPASTPPSREISRPAGKLLDASHPVIQASRRDPVGKEGVSVSIPSVSGKEKPGELFEEPESRKPPADPVVTVLAYYAEAMAANDRPGVQTSETTKAGKKRADLVRDRFAEGFTIAQLKRAIDGLTYSQFHMKNGHTELRYPLGDDNRVREFIGKAGGMPEPEPDPPVDLDEWREAAS